MSFRSTYLISFVFMMITAAVLSEIRSALPISGSIYIWAAASAGPKYARFFGFLVAWWSTVGGITFVVGICQVRSRVSRSHTTMHRANPLHRPLPTISRLNFPGGTHNSNVKWRAFIWALSEGFLALAVVINYLPPRLYSIVLKFAVVFCFLDFFLTLIWLPIGVSRTYGFRSAEDVFTSTCQRSL